MEINAWKESDKVEYTRFGNPRMPAVAVVYSYLDWHVAKHDVYGEQFCTSWEAADEDHEDMDDFNLDELHDALDDAALIDE
ncbi:Pogo transposable element with KRAB domainlike [Phytophthora cinnamomi]|nr:Pogo transposable element with KRAB domainlike [Phytophthora cinnamomi]KAG6616604.1 Pogo transposable element with KRAB domainlike [Phytophthora cinnamomi]